MSAECIVALGRWSFGYTSRLQRTQPTYGLCTRGSRDTSPDRARRGESFYGRPANADLSCLRAHASRLAGAFVSLAVCEWFAKRPRLRTPWDVPDQRVEAASRCRALVP